MARRINWSRLNSRDRMQQQGVEDKKADSVDPPKTRSLKDRPSKAELREQATAAFLAWRGEIAPLGSDVERADRVRA
jgi:hypothetical protein